MEDEYQLSVIARNRASLYGMCDDMERIADQLGGSIDIQLCTSVLSRLRLDLLQHQQDEDVFFALLQQSDPEDALLARCVQLARSEHVAIGSYALELAEPIGDICAGSESGSVDATGYLLRGSFDYIRQHLRWEDAIFFHGRRYGVESVDSAALRAGLTRNRSLRDRHLRLAE
ncbi:MAG: hemerythrin domain-containing protein [Pseudomonadota bacterium]